MSEQLKKSSMLGGIDYDHDYRVKIPFTHGNMTDMEINRWNEHCATAIEMFGLPGDKYTCRFTKTAIEFWFLDEKDAMMFELTCG
jgi:hypothetical protein